jgi:acyl-CoA reductase-like NAD-dependent aldehyde dehydrogenase
MQLIDEPLVIPLWINGHAYLTMAPAFLDVRNPVNGLVLRRTPLCGADAAQKAVDAAQAALVQWTAQTPEARSALLATVGNALAGYADHFVRLIVEESGMARDAAGVEVAAAVALLHDAVGGDALGVVGVVGSAATPLLGVLRLAVPALMAGATVVIRPNPETPSALFALAELTGRCFFPGGVFNILHGGDAAIDGLRAQAGVHLLFA